jgi:hypothetical protein
MAREKDWVMIKKVYHFLDDIRDTLMSKLIEEPNFTGKISVDINCNQGGISNIEMYTKRKID